MPTPKKTGLPRVFRVETKVVMFVFARSEKEAQDEVEQNIQRERDNFEVKIREAKEDEGLGRILHGYVEPIQAGAQHHRTITLSKTVADYRKRKNANT